MKQDFKGRAIQDIQDILKNRGYPLFYARQVFNWVYKKRVENFDLMTDLSKEGREYLKDFFFFSNLRVAQKEISADGTIKILFELRDGSAVETVLIPEGQRNTLCLSTQVGCKFKCEFCMSGQKGFERDLIVSEIINQYLNVEAYITPRVITNIVFMGIGEPLDNFVNTIGAIELLTNPAGISFSKRRISVSTCGLPFEIKKLADLNLGVKLSVSLHSSDNAIRDKLMPINKKYPLDALIKAVKYYIKLSRHSVSFEYILIKNMNVSKEDAVKLAKLLTGIGAKVNLIPFNSSCLKFSSPSEEEIKDFKNELKKRRLFFTSRKSRGQDINAACGQLRGMIDLG